MGAGDHPAAHTKGVWWARHLTALGGAFRGGCVPLELPVAADVPAGACRGCSLLGMDVRYSFKTSQQLASGRLIDEGLYKLCEWFCSSIFFPPQSWLLGQRVGPEMLKSLICRVKFIIANVCLVDYRAIVT